MRPNMGERTVVSRSPGFNITSSESSRDCLEVMLGNFMPFRDICEFNPNDIGNLHVSRCWFCVRVHTRLSSGNAIDDQMSEWTDEEISQCLALRRKR